MNVNWLADVAVPLTLPSPRGEGEPFATPEMFRDSLNATLLSTGERLAALLRGAATEPFQNLVGGFLGG